MSGRVDEAIIEYLKGRSEAQLNELDHALLEEDFYVPIGAPVRELGPGQFDVPAVCVRTEAGLGAIPVFTGLEHLQEWKPQGYRYTTLSGRQLMRMAQGMPEVSEILINLSGAPRGSIPRSDFERLLALG